MTKASKRNPKTSSNPTVTNEVAKMNKVQSKAATNVTNSTKEEKVMNKSKVQIAQVSKVASSDKAANESNPKKGFFKINSKNLVVSKRSKRSLSDALKDATERAAQWYKTSFKELYDILGDCYEIYASVEDAENKAARDYQRGAIEEAYNAQGFDEGATKTETRIVSIVFNLPDIDRKTRSRYARVIKNAHKATTKPKNAVEFVAWLTAIGGINKALEKAVAEGAEPLTAKEIESQVMSSAKVQAAVPVKTKGNRIVVMLAKPVDKDNVEIIWNSDNEALVKQILERVYKELKANGKLPPLEEHKTSKDIADEMAQAKKTAEV